MIVKGTAGCRETGNFRSTRRQASKFACQGSVVLRDCVCEDDIPTRSSIAMSVSVGSSTGSKLLTFSANLRLTKCVSEFLGMHGNMERTV
jgi:hypothetical protein